MKISTMAKLALGLIALAALIAVTAVIVLTAGWSGVLYVFGWIAFSAITVWLIRAALGEFDQ